jgi:hypothetical protein
VSEFFIPYTVCRRMKHIYTRVAEGRITYRVYVICSGENNICTGFQLVNHVSEFLGRYKSIQMTGDVSRSYKWSTKDSCAEDISRYC